MEPIPVNFTKKSSGLTSDAIIFFKRLTEHRDEIDQNIIDQPVYANTLMALMNEVFKDGTPVVPVEKAS